MGQRLEALNEHLTRVIDLRRATSVLDWDQEVYMPEEGCCAALPGTGDAHHDGP